MIPLVGFRELSSVAGFLFVMGLVLVLVVTVVGTFIAARRAKERFYEGMAKRLKGHYVPAGLLRHPRIEFSVAGRPARVEFVPSSNDSSGCTQVVIPRSGGAPGTLHILPDGFGQSFLKMFGAQDLDVGDPRFDAAYVVKAQPEGLVAQVFRADQRSRVIAAVRRLEGLNNPRIQVTLDQLRVEATEEIDHEGDVLRLVRTAEEFLEFLKVAAPVAGIHLGPMVQTADSVCPVCGTGLGGRIVRCDACRTPHHQECWSYVGQCSIYACSGRRFMS